MGECEVSMASEVKEIEVNGEKYEKSVLNIEDEKQVVRKDSHSIVDRKTWVDVVKKSCLHVKAKVDEKASGPSTKASRNHACMSASLITIPTVPRFIKTRIHEHAVQNLVELTQKTPNESVTSNTKSIKKVKSRKVVNEAAINVHVNAFDALTSDEVHEEPIKSREEIESMRREKAEGKLKSRRKGQGEKLQLLKTHKELAGEREKEREKRVRNKERNKAEKSITTFIIVLLVFCFCLRIILS